MRAARILSLALIVVLALFALCSCQSRFGLGRPNNVSKSAAQANGVFIDCSIETDVNYCSVHDPNGLLFWSGSFLLDAEGRPATQAELNFSGFREHKILLAGGRYLYSTDNPRPSLSEVDRKLSLLASSGITVPRNCGRVGALQDAGPANACARKAVKDKAPFKIEYFAQGIDDWEYFGLAGNSDQRVYMVETGQDLNLNQSEDSPSASLQSYAPVQLISELLKRTS